MTATDDLVAGVAQCWRTEFLPAFGQPARTSGEGGSIPCMGMLGWRYPDAQFAIIGGLGPASNAHGPNESLDLPTAERHTAAMALVLDEHARR